MGCTSDPGVPVIFKGGPVGGETSMIERQYLGYGKPYQVPTVGGPVVAYRRDEVATLPPPPPMEMNVEIYKWCGERDSYGNYIMRWENPAPALRLKVQELQTAIKKAKEALNG